MTEAPHPRNPAGRTWREVLLWSLPALVAGAVLRGLILSYLPHATLRPDSDSYLSFAYRFLLDGDLSLYAKRRYTYPIALLPLSALPGAPLRWIAWGQHLGGWLAVLPLAYLVRVVFARWRLWIVPITLVWALFPMAVWYEHEVLADAPFALLFLTAIAGWTFWLRHRCTPAAWWAFFVPFALCVLTKPAGKFLWPTLAVAFLAQRGWRGWRWPQAAALAGVALLSAMQGDAFMAARHLFMSTFPALPLDTPLHAELKAELRPLVEQARADLPVYHDADERPFVLARKGGAGAADLPLWSALVRDERRATRVMRELGHEALRASPGTLAWIAAQRIVASANPSAFDERAFLPDYSRGEAAESLTAIARDAAKAARVIPFLFGLDPDPGTPPVARALASYPMVEAGATTSDRVRRFAEAFNARAALFTGERYRDGRPQSLERMLPPTALGWAVAAGGVIALFRPRFRLPIGVWVVTGIVYLAGVFAVASAYPRFFLPVWPVLLLALCVAFESLLDLVHAAIRRIRAGFRAAD